MLDLGKDRLIPSDGGGGTEDAGAGSGLTGTVSVWFVFEENDMGGGT
jgi:hypothetical protein